LALILSIDTSSKTCSAAVHQNGVLLGNVELFNDKSASAMLTTAISQAVKIAGLTLQDLDAVAVAMGPGSFTGLRIAVSTAKGLCFALDKPLLAVNTLEAMALQVQPFASQNALLCPMLDARRMEVYCALYNAQNLSLVSPVEAKIIDSQSFSEYLEKQVILFFGDGSQKCKTPLEHQPNAFFIDGISPLARTVGNLAEGRFNAGKLEDIASFEPFYLKDFKMGGH
jgi:tRNA threonylcarbamoyladenosine biosynthesis protein TsaB